MRARTKITAAVGAVAVTGAVAIVVFLNTKPVERHPVTAKAGPVISIVALPWSDGSAATLAWNVRNANRVTLDGEDVPVEGTRKVPLAARRYEIHATGEGGNADSSVEVRPEDAVMPDRQQPPVKPAAVRSAVPAGLVHMDAKQLEGYVVKQVAPAYPQLARNAHVEGTVRFSAIIAPDGHVKELKLIAGHPLLIQAAVQALEQWRYRPVIRDGHAIEVQTEMDVRFTLKH